MSQPWLNIEDGKNGRFNELLAFYNGKLPGDLVFIPNAHVGWRTPVPATRGVMSREESMRAERLASEFKQALIKENITK